MGIGEAIIRIWQGYAKPKQIIVLGIGYYIARGLLLALVEGDMFSSGAMMLAIDFSVGMWLSIGAWKSYKNYPEDKLALPALFVVFGGFAMLFGLLKGIGG